MFTSGSDLMPMTALGRFLTFIGFLASCVLGTLYFTFFWYIFLTVIFFFYPVSVAILQAAITAQLTVSSLQQSDGINTVNDLVGMLLILSCSCFVSFRFVSFRFVSFRFVLFCFVLFCFVLFCFGLLFCFFFFFYFV